jgi:hypothetical protein
LDLSEEEHQPPQQKRARREASPVIPAIVVPRTIGMFGFVQWLGSLVSQCRYGKNLTELLSPEKQFEVTSTDGDVWLKNYTEQPKVLPPFQGVCNDLSYMLGKFLHERIGMDYTIQPVRGQCDDFFSNGTHFFLLMWPRSGDQAMQAELAKCNGNIPEGCFVVDPSFQRLLLPLAEKAQRGRYRFHKQLSLEEINPTTVNNDVYVAADKMPLWYPLGYVNELMPERVNGGGLLFFGFQKAVPPSQTPSLDFMLMPTTDDRHQMQAAHWVEQLPGNHILQQFRSRISQDLSTAELKRLFPFMWEDEQHANAPLDLPELLSDDEVVATTGAMVLDLSSMLPLSPLSELGEPESQNFSFWSSPIPEEIWRKIESPPSTPLLKNPFDLPDVKSASLEEDVDDRQN